MCRKGGGFLCRKGSRKGPGRVFLYQKGGSCGVHGTVPGQEGGGFCAGRGFLWQFLCTSCPHNSWQASILNVMQKAVANFLGSVLRVSPYWDLEVDARRQRRKYIRDVVGAMLGDDDIVVRTTGNGIVIESNNHEVRDDKEQHVSEEAIQVLQTAHQMSLSTRNMLKLERRCTRREWMEGRRKLLPYVATAPEVPSGVVSRRSAAVCPLLEVAQSQLTLNRVCGTFNIPRQDRLLIIICADATLLWQTSATKCDIHVTVRSEGVAAAGDARRWSAWWALDGLDDTHCLRAIDTKANLDQDVLDVLSTLDVWHLGNCIPSVCALTGDGKHMLLANYHKEKCWVGCHCIDSLARTNSVPAECRWGSFLRAIGPCNHVGDVEHGSCRIANAIVKQVNETLKDLIENGAPDVARAAKDEWKALVLELQKLLDEVKNGPHAERLAPRPTKAGKFDTTGGKMFFEDSALHGRVVAVLRDNLPDVAFGGVKFFLLMKHVLLSSHRMHAPWRKRDWLTQAELKEWESASERLGDCWGKMQWGVMPWVDWACVHNAYFARPFGSLYIFRSIPTEYRSQPFKRHLKNSMRVWVSLATPSHTPWNGLCGTY